jgi:hypothetical protein
MKIDEKTDFKLYANGSIVVYNRYYSDGSQFEGKRNSNKDKIYTINKTKVQAACCALWYQKKSTVLYFWTVTIPEKINEKQLSVAWNRYLTILRNNKKIENYAWVKEIQTANTGNIHYHILCDKRVDIKFCQYYWEYCLLQYCGVNTAYHNSVRLGNNPVVRNHKAVIKYLSKYATKSDCRKTNFEGKAYGYSQELITDKLLDIAEINELCNHLQYHLLIDDDFFQFWTLKSEDFKIIYDIFQNKSPITAQLK